MAEDKASNSKIEFNSANTGLNLDSSLNQVKKGMLSYALNANVENFDANSINYQNEEGNELCLNFPSGYQLISKHFIQEQNKHIFFLTNALTRDSEIGYMINNDCIYRKLVSSPCLGWDVRFPIHKIVHRITNCSTELYWPDNIARRYLDIDDVPYKLQPGTDLCDRQFTDELDCNRLKVQPDFSIPTLSIPRTVSGGEIETGVYQFAIQYSNASSSPYTSFYSITNPTPIANIDQASVNFNMPVGKSIVIDINNLDISGQFEYFNLAVIKTVNNITSVELVGTYYIDNSNKQITYTGQQKENVRLSLLEIFEDFPYYDLADDITTAQDVLIWKGVSRIERVNYQAIASQIKLQWETHRIPQTENYANEINATNFRGYLRDEVYPFELVFLLRNGKETDGFHIPGREITPDETQLPLIDSSNPDFVGDDDIPQPYWKIYNTATISGTSEQYSEAEDYKGPYQYGEFGYWESLEEYPCTEEIWGELAGKKIRHHKMPDVLVSPIIETPEFVSADGMTMGNAAVYPLGVRVNIDEIKELIFTSNLSAQQKDDIVGFKIVRGDRSTNKSIVAKGMIRNVGEYNKEDQNYIYPNYPYNDLNDDVFLNAKNNAWTQLCERFIIRVYELTSSDDEGSYLEIRYIDCDTNKTQTEKYRALGEYKICSIGKPLILSPGLKNSVTTKATCPNLGEFALEDSCVATRDPKQNIIGTVEYAEYDVWLFYKGSTQGRAVGWNDAIMAENQRVYVNSSNPRHIVHTRVNFPPNKLSGDGDGRGAITFVLQEKVREDFFCKVEEILSPAKAENKNRLIFNSPETSFAQPFLGNILKMESVMFGVGKGHFVEVKNNAKYRLLTAEAQRDALASSVKIATITNPRNYGALFLAYQSYLTIYVNGITRKNYAHSYNSIADYNHHNPVYNNLGAKQRMIDNTKYLIPVVQSVGEDARINNYQRETSVYIKTKGEPFEYGHLTNSMLNSGEPIVTEKSRFTISEKENCSKPGKEENFNVVSYYGSMKNIFDNQWGQIYSYLKVDTGLQVIFSQTGDSTVTAFGGDTFISRFSYKTKVPFFIDNRVGGLDDSDIFYDEIGNIAYPKYWHSARSILQDYNISGATASNIISYKAHNFDCPNSQEPGPDSTPPITADSNPNRTFYDGYFYLFAYGVPSFYCESSYNLDLRQAFNDREGNFWPRVSTGIPDDWVQESFVSIANDNTYNYNVSFSKQNRENNITNLPPDWSDDICLVNYPFRAIYSDLLNIDSDSDQVINNWLIYRPLSYFDFPQNFGGLTALDGIQNRAILARFENKTLLYDSLLKLDTSNPQAAYIGNSLLFRSSPPIDFAETDLGYVGSQHKFILKIPQGQITIDAKRGQIFLISGNSAKDLTALGMGMSRFFRDNLPFNILRWFPGVNVDNHYNGLGLHAVYDNKYNRVIITKLDYSPLLKDIEYDYESSEFYIERVFKGITTRTILNLNDSNYFCNKSFTISFNFNTNSWISFHSYLPSFYIGENNFFYSGINNCCGDGFDAIVGELIAYTTTTTTTVETTIIPLPTTTTTTTIIDCTMDGGIFAEVSCSLEGTAVILIPPPTTTTICVRGFNMEIYELITGYVINGVPTLTKNSLQDACNGAVYVSNLEEDDIFTPLFVSANGYDLFVGSTLYYDANSMDCTLVPDGWYFTEESAAACIIYHVVNGIIVEIVECQTTTTTTTITQP